MVLRKSCHEINFSCLFHSHVHFKTGIIELRFSKMYRILIRPTARKVIEIVILVSSMAGVLFYLTNARNRPDKQTFSVGEPVYNRNNGKLS